MADDEHSTPGIVPGLVQAYISQLRATTERLESLAGLGEHHPMTAGMLPLPGALSATQLKSMVDSIAAQRLSIQALKAQLSSFDEQLAALEQILGPFAEWSRTWADLEDRVMKMGRRPQSEDLSPDTPDDGGPARKQTRPVDYLRRRPFSGISRVTPRDLWMSCE